MRGRTQSRMAGRSDAAVGHGGLCRFYLLSSNYSNCIFSIRSRVFSTSRSDTLGG